ncbi:MAG: hypothetical protein GXX91_02620 [Verrucomicrobiaceae bacterium]|nr:hypothetical protein [Verrucomicrobiaceae bacterium]
MKASLLFLIGFLAAADCIAPCLAAAASEEKPLPPAERARKIAEVEAGTLKTARASWWGFDPEDATDCLQAAINSKVATLVVDKPGGDWVISRPLQLVSHQRIIFSDGVVVRAKEGAFKGIRDSLFTGRELTDIALVGEGEATLRMRRADYDNPDLYEKAEWRHGIALWDCRDVVIRGFTVTETGGDGLYLGASATGYNHNVLVEDMRFDANYRQGISVISAENLTIRRCELTNTDGTNPQAGIDFEPNLPGQRVVGCVLEDCVLSGNTGGGLVIYTVNLNGDSPPVSITATRCVMSGNSVGMASTITRSPENPVAGEVVLDECIIERNRVSLRNPVVGSARYLFKNCTLDFTSPPGETVPDWKRLRISLTLDAEMSDRAVGGVAFDNTVVKTDGEADPIALRFQARAELTDQITGTLLVRRDGETTPFDLAGFVARKRTELAEINALEPAELREETLRPPSEAVPGESDGKELRTRNRFTYLQYAEAGETVTLRLTMGKVQDREVEVELRDPDGKRLAVHTLPADEKTFSLPFTAGRSGLYRLVRTQEFSHRIGITSSRPGGGYLVEDGLEFLSRQGRLYFEVPAGVASFTVGVSSDSTVDVALLNPAGEEVRRETDIQSLELFSAERTETAAPEIWSLDISNAVWAVTVRLYAPLQPVVATRPETLLRSVR